MPASSLAFPFSRGEKPAAEATGFIPIALLGISEEFSDSCDRGGAGGLDRPPAVRHAFTGSAAFAVG
ncbi:hypothetical protein AB0K51_09235, partial [Kitasatospora sp. NPDC049285]|uniref:hypothetical protein n=1 Tax=Kitasatospora sp. NPDC049285 TaxID=3157096 RepID=UPI00341D5981